MKNKCLGALALILAIIVTPVFARDDNTNRLPPGLQKKVAAGKPLPPGWQKKLAKGKTLDREVYRRCHTVSREEDRGIVTVMVDGKILRLIENTREIIEILR